MASNGKQQRRIARGHITLVQEERFRLLAESERSLLFTLSHKANVGAAELRRFKELATPVQVEYAGEPGLESAAVYKVDVVHD